MSKEFFWIEVEDTVNGLYTPLTGDNNEDSSPRVYSTKEAVLAEIEEEKEIDEDYPFEPAFGYIDGHDFVILDEDTKEEVDSFNWARVAGVGQALGMR